MKPLVEGLGDIDAKSLATFPVGDPEDGIVLRVGRYGPYIEGPEDGEGAAKRANVPDDLPPDELTAAKARELFANPAGAEIELGVHPDTGLQVVAKNGRFGPYVTEVLPEDAEVALVGHSAGGLVAMNLAGMPEANDAWQLTHVVAVGSPIDFKRAYDLNLRVKNMLPDLYAEDPDFYRHMRIQDLAAGIHRLICQHDLPRLMQRAFDVLP